MSDDSMSDDEILRNQDPDFQEDFGGEKEWPFSDKGDADDVPTPTGTACGKISYVLSGASEDSGDFSFGGQADLLPPVPGLFVDGVGPIPVPLWEDRAQKLIEKCEKSPFGHNMDTKTDEHVRKSWQLAPDQLQFRNPQWQRGIDKMAVTIADRLGYKGIPLTCVPYKLLVYGEGGHFLKHQDTEKKKGMIATLVIQPPSLHEGGDLVVFRNGEVEHRHDFGKADGTATYLPHYAVHYADAEHAVEKVTKGYRLVLVYSICLPPTMQHLGRNPNKTLSAELADIIETMEPGDNSFALLLAHEYTDKSMQTYGAGALKGIDRSRFRALEDANASASADKKLQLFIAKLYHHVHFQGLDEGKLGDWDEEGRDEKVTWFTLTGSELGAGDDVRTKFNFLNPEKDTRSKLWKKPYGSSRMHAYLGNEGPLKDSVYSRYAIVAWAVEENLENTLKFINLETAFKALREQPPVEAATLRTMVELASAKLMEGNANVTKVRFTLDLPKKLPVPVSLDLFKTVSRLSQDSDDPALTNLLFKSFFRYLKEKEAVVAHVVTLLRKFAWRDVCQPLLESLAGNNMVREPLHLSLTLLIANELKQREAHRALLAFAAEKASKLDDKFLSSSDKLEELWKCVLRSGNDPTLETLSARFTQMSPRLLKQTAKMFLQQLRNANVADDRKAVLVSIVACRSDWLRSLVRVLVKPFSWEMPGAEFPANESIEAFLRGPESEMTTKGIVSFQGLGEARAFASKYSGRWKSEQVNCSFEMDTKGGGSDIFVMISKTPHWYYANRDILPQLKEELDALTDATVETLVGVISRSRGHP